jgi:small-conductance mechanosensitive channel
MATTLGVPTIAYAPWAVFCYGGPIFSLLIAAAYRRTGWGLKRLVQPAGVGAVLLLLLAVAGGASPVVGAPTQDPQDTVVQDTLDTLAQDTLPQDALAQEPVEAVDEERAALDEAIRNRLQAVFDRVPTLAGVEVTVDAGVVRLSGTVLSGQPRTRAAELASRQDGVLFVDNRIRESTSLEEHLQPTWTRLSELGWGTLAKLPLILVALLIVALAALLGTLIARWTTPATARLGNPFLQSLIRRALRGLLVLGGIIVALDLLDATALVGAVVGTAGLAGLALGFAFKDIVENYLAGTLLAVRQPFAKNDHVRVEEFEGKVVRLTARETILMTLEGNHVRLPNALVFRNPLVNYTRNPLRRFQFYAGVGPDDDLARARDVAVATLVDMEGVLADPPPQALVHELGDSTVTMRFTGWIDQREAGFDRVRSEAIRVVKARLEEAGLTMPSPQYNVQLGGEVAPSTAPMEPEPTPRPSPDTPPPASAADVAPADIEIDHSVDEQIEAERQASDEEDLLDRADDDA